MILGNSIFKAVGVALLLAPAASSTYPKTAGSTAIVEEEFIFKEDFEADVVHGALRRGLQQACVPADNPSAVWVCGTPGMRNSSCRTSSANCDRLSDYSCRCNGNMSTCSYCRVQMSNGIICQKTGSSTTFTDLNDSLSSCTCSDSGNGQPVQQCRVLEMNNTPLEDARPPPVPAPVGIPSPFVPSPVAPRTPVVQGTVTSPQGSIPATGAFPTPGFQPTPIPPTNVIQGTVTSPQGSTNAGVLPPTARAPTQLGQQPALLAGANVIVGSPTNSFGERAPWASTAQRPGTVSSGATGPVSSGKSSKQTKRNARFSHVSALP